MSFPVPWSALHDAGLILAVCALLSAVARAVHVTTAATIRKERDAWLIAQLPEIAQHEVLSARRERDEERARAERAEREAEELRLQLGAARRAHESERQALYGVQPASPAQVFAMSGRRRQGGGGR